MNTYLEIEDLFLSASAAEYLGEDITLVEHMIQCAELAQRDNAPSWLVVAALLHDIGHILSVDAAHAQDSGVDRHHDLVGADWIAQRFPENIVQVVKLHVEAKKYLVANDKSYFDKLSEASKVTLKIQGGEFTSAQSQEFLATPFSAEAIRLRIWDDCGKKRGGTELTLADFKDAIEENALA